MEALKIGVFPSTRCTRVARCVALALQQSAKRNVARVARCTPYRGAVQRNAATLPQAHEPEPKQAQAGVGGLETNSAPPCNRISPNARKIPQKHFGF
jgi:hypothetical protein